MQDARIPDPARPKGSTTGGFLFAGLFSLGVLLGGAYVLARKPHRTIEVKGVAERVVKATDSTWILRFTLPENDAQLALRKAESQRNALLAFAERQGFKTEEREPLPLQLSDKLASSYGGQRPEYRFQASAGVTLRTTNVDTMIAASQKVDEIVREGITLMDGSEPQYLFNGLNDLKSEMLTDATKNARASGAQFATDAGAQLGKILNAQQGLFSISARDDNSSEYYGGEKKSVMKNVRVVVSLSFELVE